MNIAGVMPACIFQYLPTSFTRAWVFLCLSSVVVPSSKSDIGSLSLFDLCAVRRYAHPASLTVHAGLIQISLPLRLCIALKSPQDF